MARRRSAHDPAIRIFGPKSTSTYGSQISRAGRQVGKPEKHRPDQRYWQGLGRRLPDSGSWERWRCRYAGEAMRSKPGQGIPARTWHAQTLFDDAAPNDGVQLVAVLTMVGGLRRIVFTSHAAVEAGRPDHLAFDVGRAGIHGPWSRLGRGSGHGFSLGKPGMASRRTAPPSPRKLHVLVFRSKMGWVGGGGSAPS